MKLPAALDGLKEEIIANLSGRYRRHSDSCSCSGSASNADLLQQSRSSTPVTSQKFRSSSLGTESKKYRLSCEPCDATVSIPPYDFYCRNASPNLRSMISRKIMPTDDLPTSSGSLPTSSGSLPTSSDDLVTSADGLTTSVDGLATSSGSLPTSADDLPTVSLFDHDQFDISDRIIPAYYINEHGIKGGALQFSFYDSILDSIRNMRALTPYQYTYLTQCSKEECLEMIREYNQVIQSFIANQLLETDTEPKGMDQPSSP
jgi:hypothetical protein